MPRTRWQGLDTAAEGSGITEPLSEQVNLVGEIVGRAVVELAGEETLERIQRLRTWCKEAAADGPDAEQLLDRVASEIAALDLNELRWQLRAYTAFFHLVNKAEQIEIARINRARATDATPETPRPESVAEAFLRLHDAGRTADELATLLERLDIQPTLTAHPTEARRRTVLHKQGAAADLLQELQRGPHPPAEEDRILTRLHEHISLLLATDELRAERPRVADEVAFVLHFVRETLWKVIPDVVRDMERAGRLYFDLDRNLVPRTGLRIRSWVGGDRDGNPNVTAEVTRETLDAHRRAAIELHAVELRQLWHDLSLSDRQDPISDALRQSIDEDRAAGLITDTDILVHGHEPFRLKVAAILAKLERGWHDARAYSADELRADVDLLAQGLIDFGFEALATHGKMSRLRIRARAFGLHLAALDVRQHSRMHEGAVAELLRLGGVEPHYERLNEKERQTLLSRELENPRPLAPARRDLSPDTARVVDPLRVIADADPEAFGGYVISMTDAPSDVLEVLLLAKETGLWHMEDGRVTSPLDVAPLLETIDDLKRARPLLTELFSLPIYQAHLKARGSFQEVMLGYSDSNKDGGYWMANWSLHRAQATIADVGERHGIEIRLFHGRGGTVGRGGGRASQAILAMPPSVHNGRVRFTEQGEVISFRYALRPIAHRHLEQIIHAVLLAAAGETGTGPGAIPDENTRDLMDRIAEASMKAYRELVEAEGFWSWYVRTTPIEAISRMPIASRPASRTGASVELSGLRAIPWNFAWTQTRYLVPGWYGIGAGLGEVAETHLEDLQRMYREWPFFRAVVSNAEREMARARLSIARRYARAGGHDGLDGARDSFHHRIAADYDRACKAILAITGDDALLASSPVIRRSIEIRNPYTDVLNLIQVELLKRYRSASTEDQRAHIRELLFLSLNGIAAAMQSTG